MSACEWDRANTYQWMTDDQFECYQMLADLMGGPHHIYGKVKPCGHGIQLNSHDSWSSFDFDQLTRAIVFAHDRMIRFEIGPSGPGMVRVTLHKRHTRTGQMSERHPTIEDAIERIRKA